MNITRRGLFRGGIGALLTPIVAKVPALGPYARSFWRHYDAYEVFSVGASDAAFGWDHSACDVTISDVGGIDRTESPFWENAT